LSDAQRTRALADLRRLLANDARLHTEVHAFLGSALQPRHKLEGEALAMELRRRKAERKLKRPGQQLQKSIAELSEEQRSRLARRLRAVTARSKPPGRGG